MRRRPTEEEINLFLLGEGSERPFDLSQDES
jgi:hypothetical protein